MSEQLTLDAPLLRDPARVRLTCAHRVLVPSRRALPLRRDGWYASVWCPTCRRDREVVILVYGAGAGR